ncbi:hypothetical protein Dimus_037534, partial [Dionaea muscipula]
STIIDLMPGLEGSVPPSSQTCVATRPGHQLSELVKPEFTSIDDEVLAKLKVLLLRSAIGKSSIEGIEYR